MADASKLPVVESGMRSGVAIEHVASRTTGRATLSGLGETGAARRPDEPKVLNPSGSTRLEKPGRPARTKPSTGGSIGRIQPEKTILASGPVHAWGWSRSGFLGGISVVGQGCLQRNGNQPTQPCVFVGFIARWPWVGKRSRDRTYRAGLPGRVDLGKRMDGGARRSTNLLNG